MWMLPFVTRTDLETPAKEKGVSQETRNTFLNKILAEHSLPGVRGQLMTLWATWMESNYAEEPVAVAASQSSAHSMDAPTPPDEDEAPAPVMTEDQMMANVAGAAEASGGAVDAA